MKKITTYLAAFSSLLTLSLLIISCNQSPMSGSTPTPSKPSAITSNKLVSQSPTIPVNPELVTANTRFGFKLFSQVQKQQSDQNIFISPASISMALAMAYNGAGGETQKAIAKTLELQGLSLEDINQGNANLKQVLLAADPQVKLAIANSLWANQDITLNPEFIQTNQQFYGAEVNNLNFSDPNSVGKINNWVKEKTNGKIDKIVDQLSPQQILWLVNAIYFKGTWSEPFSKKQTQERPFTLLDGRQKQHPLMSQSDSYRYLENQQFQAVSLPYGKGRLSLYVFLPKQNSNLQNFYNNLSAQNWEQWMKQFKSRPGSVSIPRFKLEYDITLNDSLKALGMTPAFNPEADFTGISKMQAKIDTVKHKTFVEVNEEGTEAAAVTGIGIRATSMPTDAPFKMVVDRPFFCAIRDNQTGTILFMGSIVNPE